jgi:hypothetical protein
MKVKNILLITVLLISMLSKAQDAKSILKKQANEMANASVTGDYNLIMKFTYPKKLESFT